MGVASNTFSALEYANRAYALSLSNPEPAVAEAEKALLKARLEQDREAAIRAWHAKGMAYLVRGRLSESWATAADARLDLAERFGASRVPEAILVLEADILRHRGDLHAAFECLIEAGEGLAEGSPDKTAFRVRLSFAICLAVLGEGELSLDYFDALIADTDAAQDQAMALAAAVYRCYALNALGHFEEALASTVALQPEVEAKAGPYFLAEILDNRGAALTGLGQPAEAEAWLRKALAMERSLNREAYLAHSRLHLAQACLDLGRYAEAEGLARSVRDAAVQSGDLSLAASSCRIMAACLEALSHWREAAGLYRECLDLCRRLSDSRNRSTALLARHGKLTKGPNAC